MECFKVYVNDIEGRLDCFYYKPEFVKLEKTLKRQTSKTLEEYIISIAGGATPDKDETEKYYSNSTEGIPFLRVQNLSEEGLNLEGVKYIKPETHNGMLKRSQVKEGYLLTKITGVGRMAVSSVTPKGFEGNINQHIVAIKTESCKTSEVLAAFLNSDIGERLAFRRSTGGTRPALDYEALKTIPIVFKPEILEIMQSVYKQKKQKKQDAEKLLGSIDKYVLTELGIKLPELKDKKYYVVDSGEAKKRVDPYFYQPKYLAVEQTLKKSKYKLTYLKDTFSAKLVKGILPKQEEKNGDANVLQIRNIQINGAIDISKHLTAKNIFSDEHKLNNGDVLIVITGATIGKVGLWSFKRNNFYLGGDIVKFQPNDKFNPYYIQAFLLSDFGQIQIKRNITGATNKHLSPDDVEKIRIPIAPIDIQKRIAIEVKSHIEQAKRLETEANSIIENARQEVETIILGKAK